MNTKTLPIGPAEREQKDVQTKIGIVLRSINKYKSMLNSKEFIPDEILITITTKLEREELNLQRLKDLYPEHFI